MVSVNVSYDMDAVITQIRAIDNFFNGTGGYASVINGGLGEYNVEIRLSSSAAGRGFNFTVDVYCR